MKKESRERIIAAGTKGRTIANQHRHEPLPSEVFDWDTAIARLKMMLGAKK